MLKYETLDAAQFQKAFAGELDLTDDDLESSDEAKSENKEELGQFIDETISSETVSDTPSELKLDDESEKEKEV